MHRKRKLDNDDDIMGVAGHWGADCKEFSCHATSSIEVSVRRRTRVGRFVRRRDMKLGEGIWPLCLSKGHICCNYCR